MRVGGIMETQGHARTYRCLLLAPSCPATLCLLGIAVLLCLLVTACMTIICTGVSRMLELRQ